MVRMYNLPSSGSTLYANVLFGLQREKNLTFLHANNSFLVMRP